MNFQEQNDVERLLLDHTIEEKIVDFHTIWGYYKDAERSKEVPMSGKKGGAKVAIWLSLFAIVAVAGWFGMTKYTAMKQQQTLESGNAMLVTLIVGDVEVKKSGSGDWTALYVDDVLKMGDEIKTADESYCEIQMIGRGIYRLESGTEMALSQLENVNGAVQATMTLNSGQVALKPEKLHEGETFQVETSTAIAAVRGTRFSVAVNGDGDTSVAVAEGTVAVAPNVTAIDDAANRGLVSQGAADTLQEQLVGTTPVTAGEELNVMTSSVKTLDAALTTAIETTVSNSGAITEDKLTAPDSPTGQSEVVLAVRDMAAADVAAATGTTAAPDVPLGSVVATRRAISEQALAILDQVTEDKIIQNVVEMVKVAVNSQPQGAVVFVDGVRVGTTPYVQIVQKNSEIALTLTADGYNDYNQTYKVDANTRMNIVAVMDRVNVPVSTTVSVEPTNAEVAAVTTTVAGTAEQVAAVSTTTTTVKQILPGDLLWNKSIAFVSETKDPVTYRGTMFATVGNKLYVISPNGTVLKTVTVIDSGTLTKPTVGDGLVFVGSDGGGVWAFDTSGNKVWSKSDAGKEMMGGVSPVAGSGIVAVPSIDNGISVYDSQSGATVAHISEPQQIFSKPLIVNGGKILVYAVEQGDVIGYDLQAKTELWRKKIANRIIMPILGNDSAAVVFDRDSGTFYGLNPSTGDQVWSKVLAATVKTTYYPVYISGKILVISKEADKVYVLYAKTGEILLNKTIAGISSYPFVSGEWVYVGTSSGGVYGFNYSSGASWSKTVSGAVSMISADDNGVYALTAGTVTGFAR